MGGNMFILVTGIICFVLDLIYIYFLYIVRKHEKQEAPVVELKSKG